MENTDETVRVWVGLNLLQAQLMRQCLLDNEIECIYASHNAVGYEAGVFEYSLWVAQKDVARARGLLEQVEEEMRMALDADLPAEEEPF